MAGFRKTACSCAGIVVVPNSAYASDFGFMRILNAASKADGLGSGRRSRAVAENEHRVPPAVSVDQSRSWPIPSSVPPRFLRA